MDISPFTKAQYDKVSCKIPCYTDLPVIFVNLVILNTLFVILSAAKYPKNLKRILNSLDFSFVSLRSK